MLLYTRDFAAFIFLGIILTMVNCVRQVADSSCIDHAKWCGKLGRKVPLARCYDLRHRSRCCQSCQKLKLPLKGCEYGDRQSTLCESIDRTRPIGDCYSDNKTCCQTCQLYDSGIPGCPFGDRVNWCSGIGDRYSISSCYDHEIHCCGTCMKYRTGIPGDTSDDTRCRYGDRGAWCQMIGGIMPPTTCDNEESKGICCETCKLLKKAREKFPLIESNPSVSPTKTSTSHYTDRTVIVTQTPPLNSIKNSGTTVSQNHRENTLQPKEPPGQSNKQLNSTPGLPWVHHGNITFTTREGANSSTFNYRWLGDASGNFSNEKDSSSVDVGNSEEIMSSNKNLTLHQQQRNFVITNKTADGNMDSGNNNKSKSDINHQSPSINKNNETADSSNHHSNTDRDINVLYNNETSEEQYSDSTVVMEVNEYFNETKLLNRVSSGSRRLQVGDIIKFIPLLLTYYVHTYGLAFTQLHNQLWS